MKSTGKDVSIKGDGIYSALKRTLGRSRNIQETEGNLYIWIQKRKMHEKENRRKLEKLRKSKS